MSKWLPISTAPKDGTEVLLTDGVHFAAASWIDQNYPDRGQRGYEPFFEWFISDWHNDPIHLRGSVYATHWMPIEPPRD